MDGFVMFAITSVVASVIWGLRLEGQVGKTNQRVDDQEKYARAEKDGLKELINSKFNAQDDRLERIERALNGTLYGHR